MIHDQGMEARAILKEALQKFQGYYPASKFGQQSDNWHKLNMNQIMTDLSRDNKTKFTELEDFETALNRGITGEWDDKLTPAISLVTFPIIKKWIIRHKAETLKVTTGEQYQEPIRNPDRHPDRADSISTVCSWLIRTTFNNEELGMAHDFDEATKKEGLRIISEDPNPDRFSRHKEILNQ